MTKRQYADFLAREALRTAPVLNPTAGYDDDYGQEYWGSVEEDDWDYSPAPDNTPLNKWHNATTVNQGLALREAAAEQARMDALNSQARAMMKDLAVTPKVPYEAKDPFATVQGGEGAFGLSGEDLAKYMSETNQTRTAPTHPFDVSVKVSEPSLAEKLAQKYTGQRPTK